MSSDKIAGEFYYDGLPRYITELEKWFYPQQQLAYDNAVLPDGNWRLCLGVLVYGSYVERFLEFCVPSLLATGNLMALPDPLVIVHTDKASADKIAAGLEELKRFARVEIHIVPQILINTVPDHTANKYWLLGAAGNLHMQQAKYRAHSYHMLMPDHVYASGYFAGLKKLHENGKRAIVQGGLSAVIESVAGPLQAAKGEWAPSDLAALALDNLHPQLLPFLMNGRKDYPISLMVLMVGSDAVKMASPHMSIVYLSHEVLMKAPLRLFNTIDAQCPFFIQQEEPYVPSIEDGMVYIEISNVSKACFPPEGCSLDEFCARFWIVTCCHRDFERYFGLTTSFPLPSGYRHLIEPMSGDEIAETSNCVRRAVADSYDKISALVPPQFKGDPLLRAMESA